MSSLWLSQGITETLILARAQLANPFKWYLNEMCLANSIQQIKVLYQAKKLSYLKTIHNREQDQQHYS